MRIEPLPVERWDELEHALQEAKCQELKPIPVETVMLGAFEEGRLVGCIGAERVECKGASPAWYVYPIWVSKDQRGSGLPLLMIQRLETYNTEGLSEYCSTTSPHVEKLISQLNFERVDGELWRRKHG